MAPPDRSGRGAAGAGIAVREIGHLRDLLAPFGCDAETLGSAARREEAS